MKKVYNGMLVPYDWYFDLTKKLGSELPDEALGKERLWMLFLSLREGKQVMSGNVEIDYPVGSLLLQTDKMRKEAPDKDVKIALMRGEGKTSKEIGAILGMSDGTVRKTSGWKDYKKYMTEVGAELVPHEEESTEPVEEEHKIIGNAQFNF